jgi:nucleoside-diphosphate-sugar epimerase
MPHKGKILITGATGFIGGALLGRRHFQNPNVIGFTRATDCSDSRLHTCDLLNSSDLCRLLSDVGPVATVIHCASIAHGQKLDRSVASYNLELTKNLVDAVGPSARYIFTSSIDVYGINECLPRSPHQLATDNLSSYAFGKIKEEVELIKKCDDVHIIRLPPVYSNSNYKDMQKRIFLPRTKLPYMLFPNPVYTMANINSVTTYIELLLDNKKDNSGHCIHHIDGVQNFSQKELLKRFTKYGFPLPAQPLLRFGGLIGGKTELMLNKLCTTKIIEPCIVKID